MNLLVVEDAARQRCPLAAQLRALGHEVDVASDGAQALARAASRSYDIIILDLMLPRESSLPVLHEIREASPEVWILVLATQNQIHDRITALIQGADDYLVKPFSRDQLRRRVQQAGRRAGAAESPRAGARQAPEDPGYSNRLIAELLEQCRCGPGEIELVISEVRPARLWQQLGDELRRNGARNDVTLHLPRGGQPVMLVDARWMQRLLVILLGIAIELSPRGGVVEVELQPRRDFCHISITSRLSRPLADAGREARPSAAGTAAGGALDSLALAGRYAAYLNLELQVRVDGADRLCTRLDRIKIV